ncbi:MAG TPA: TetR/AcrR family transcriptional regulator [Candidatus Dormibacteraeota bacterium]|nr:TetR/AcrR family transcriptional regulator [Candidatus Dormibacteraeota bacterium]
MDLGASERRAPGRPRDQEAMRAIHRAAIEVLKEGGYGGLTIEKIASRAGVGRQTIYRWWPSKADVVLDAMNASAEENVVADDLAGFVRATYTDRGAARMLSGLMAEAQLDPDFAKRFRAAFLDRRREILIEIAAKELPPGVDLEVVADMVFGPLWYLMLTRPELLDVSYAENVLAAISGIEKLPKAESPRSPD